MNKRDTKFVARIIVLSMSALALGLGARIVLPKFDKIGLDLAGFVWEARV